MDQPLSDASLSLQRNKVKRKVALAMLIFAILLYTIHWLFTPTVNQTSLRTAVIELGGISATINTGGIVVPTSEATISSEINSQIVEVLAQLGQQVEKGTPLIKLETRALEYSIENIRENIALKGTQINAKKYNSNKVTNEIKSRSQLLDVELELRTVKAKRLGQLSLTGAASKHEFLEANINVKRTEIELKQLKQSIEDHQSATNAEIEGLRLEKSILDKSLYQKERLLERSMVIATRDGVLSWINDEEGASVTVGQPLVKISDAQNFRVEATLSDFYAPQLNSGMEATIFHNKQKFKGHLVTLSPTITDGVMKLIIRLEQPSHPVLHRNLRVDVGLITDRADDVMTITKGPFITNKGQQSIFVIREGIAYRMTVNIGLSNKDKYQITGDIAPGDEIIISDTTPYLHLKEFTIN
ncbi:MAG: HlyD family efflux transporter periplasmic adaptor subunit [Kangiellaceae bacterium]|nr:HlyD family efflux transporter periplasmic adaptor subunit [Kangiellaceae bacterium]